MQDERYEKITTELSRLSSLLVENITEIRGNTKRLEDIVKAHSDTLWDRDNGLEKQVDRLVENQKDRDWWFKAASVPVLGLVIEFFSRLVKH